MPRAVGDRSPKGPHVIGLDLSKNAPAAVAVPATFAAGDGALAWGTVRKWKLEAQDDTLVWRERNVREGLRSFLVSLEREGCKIQGVYAEDYAHTQMARRGGWMLCEVGGVVRVMLAEVFGQTMRMVVAASARKLLLGKVPREKTSGMPVKEYVFRRLRQMRSGFTDFDHADAFVVANYGLHDLGLPCLASEE